MKTFLKIFVLSFFAFVLAFYLGGFSYLKENNIKVENNIGFEFYENIEPENKLLTKLETKLETKPKTPTVYSNLEEALEKSTRVNFLILGMEDVRSDTIILASFNPETKKMDLLSIPRDTYVHRKGFNSGEDRKVNSIYKDHGIEGVKKTISYVLEGTPIHHYVLLDYEGVEKIVDILGGVEVDIPFHMKYRDPTAIPPLNIDLKEGRQTLNGKESLDFIRYRKGNNRKGYIDGDLGRIKAQQQFLSAFASKASDRIITVFTKGFEYVKSDINLFEALSYGRKAIGIKSEDINFHTIPGKSDYRSVNKKMYSYFIYNSKEVKNVLEQIYNVKKTVNSE